LIILKISEDKELHVEREYVEAAIQNLVAAKLELLKTEHPLLRSAVKGVADMIMSMTGVKAPKDVDKVEFLAAYCLKLGLDAIEGHPIPVQAREVVTSGATDSD
jgi:hypothetical protein